MKVTATNVGRSGAALSSEIESLFLFVELAAGCWQFLSTEECGLLAGQLEPLRRIRGILSKMNLHERRTWFSYWHALGMKHCLGWALRGT